MKEYKFIPYFIWENDFNSEYPNARSNVEKTEVVLSCLHNDGTHTKEQATKYIKDNWTQTNEV